MRLAGVRINNWRSIKEISCGTGRVTALVGANNAGKTAILSALNLLMGPTWPSTRGLEDSDFYRRQRNGGLKVQVWFEQGSGLHSAWYQVASEEGGETGARVQYSPDGKIYTLNGETRDRFPLVYIEADRGFERQFEEPELFRHPHSQRGLMRMFREIAANGTQILYSTHSSAFVSIERFDEIVIVERGPDEWDEEVCSSVRSLSGDDLVDRHRRNRPGESFELDGIRARYRHNLGPEHTEAMFGRAVVLVEGATEAAALPMYADGLGMNLDALGISIVNARGKDSLESLYHLYAGFGFPVYVIFDNDVGKRGDGEKLRRQESNRRLTRLLGLPVSDAPDPCVGPKAAIMGTDFETTIQAEVDMFQAGLYERLAHEAGTTYGTLSKPIKARYVAEYLGVLDYVPPTVRLIMRTLAALVGATGPDLPPETTPSLPPSKSALFDASLDDELPF